MRYNTKQWDERKNPEFVKLLVRPNFYKQQFTFKMKFSQKLQVWKKKALYLVRTCTKTVHKTWFEGSLSYLYLFLIPYFL